MARMHAWEMESLRVVDDMTVMAFGQFLLSVDGEKELLSFLPQEWKCPENSLQKCCKTVTLHLETDPTLKGKSPSDGWSFQSGGESQQAVYSSNRKALFSLRYNEAEKKIKVSVRDSQRSAARLGVQYGMMLALYQQCVGLHGVTLVCGNEIIILSAPSGTGKTTLSKLLEKYCDAVVINGDFALLSLTADGVIYEPTPFCGSSGRSLNHRFRVKRVVFLGQAKENTWYSLTGREAMRRFMSNAFVPDWDKRLQQAVQENILRCMSVLKVNAYDFAPTKEAAETFLRRIEEDSPLCSE